MGGGWGRLWGWLGKGVSGRYGGGGGRNTKRVVGLLPPPVAVHLHTSFSQKLSFSTVLAENDNILILVKWRTSGPTPLLQKGPFFTMPRPMGIRSLNRCVNDCAHMFCPSPMKLSFLFFCFRPPHRALDARIGRPKRCFHPLPTPPPYTAHTAYLENLKKPYVG